jgi:hypothetical protein
LGNLSSLQLLDVSENQFTGNIASGPFTNLISLEFLSLSNNLFKVPTSMKPFLNHSSHKFFSSENNRLVTEPAAFHDLIPKFQLVFFSLSKTTEALNVDLPDFLYYQCRGCATSRRVFHFLNLGSGVWYLSDKYGETRKYCLLLVENGMGVAT